MNPHSRKKYKRYRNYRHNRKHRPREICPVCSKPINKILTSIVHKETGKKAHFDCILRLLKTNYNLKPNEDVYYIGGGSFAIIEEAKGKKTRDFIIKRRIQYEEKPS
jgi:hypothetical protein